MFKLKKASQQTKKNLSQNAVKRKDISKSSGFDRQNANKKKLMIEASKKKKAKH